MEYLIRTLTVTELHEFRTRLTIAALATELLRRGHPDSADTMRLTKMLADALAGMTTLMAKMDDGAHASI